MDSEVLLETKDLIRVFGENRAVDGLNLQVHAGEMVGLVGPDGAGKTTAIRLMCGLLHPTSGTINLAGFELPAQVERARGPAVVSAVSAVVLGLMAKRSA